MSKWPTEVGKIKVNIKITLNHNWYGKRILDGARGIKYGIIPNIVFIMNKPINIYIIRFIYNKII